VRELREAYSPNLDELEWARQITDSDEALLSLTMCLKCCQRLGYFARFDEIPTSIVAHLRQELGLRDSADPTTVPDKTLRNHRGLVRHRLGLVSDQTTARKIAAEAIRTAAETKDNPADLINIALEELVKSNCELPGYTTLDRMAGRIRTEVNTRIHELVHARMTEAVMEMIDTYGGLVDLLAEHEALAAYHGGNHLPLLERFYRSSRGLLLRLLNALEFEATSTDHRLLRAVEWVKANQDRISEYVTDEVLISDPGTGITTRERLDTKFALEAWQKVIRDKRHPGKLARRHFELCVLSCLADELVRGDIAAASSDLYANWQRQLLSFADCEPYLPGYCREVGLPEDGTHFVAELKAAMKGLALQVDAGYPDNADLVIEEDGRPSLKARRGAERTASARALEAGVKERLAERSLLEVLARSMRWVGWHRHLGPLSGSDPKLADRLERYMLVALTYGCNLGPHQAARHLSGRVSAHELGSTFGRHVTVAALNKAIADVVDAYLELDLAKVWGDASAVAVDGTKQEIYVDNLVAEYHIRYGTGVRTGSRSLSRAV
jgi:hypothetical protein